MVVPKGAEMASRLIELRKLANKGSPSQLSKYGRFKALQRIGKKMPKEWIETLLLSWSTILALILSGQLPALFGATAAVAAALSSVVVAVIKDRLANKREAQEWTGTDKSLYIAYTLGTALSLFGPKLAAVGFRDESSTDKKHDGVLQDFIPECCRESVMAYLDRTHGAPVTSEAAFVADLAHDSLKRLVLVPVNVEDDDGSPVISRQNSVSAEVLLFNGIDTSKPVPVREPTFLMPLTLCVRKTNNGGSVEWLQCGDGASAAECVQVAPAVPQIIVRVVRFM